MKKRAFDIVLAVLALGLTAPLLLLICLAVRVSSQGAILFYQTRIGRNGMPFKIAKFRTMIVGAESLGPSITKSGDFRITRIGAFLRKTKLDELPQLWNVLCGHMSFVGPRPEVPKYVAVYDAHQREVLKLRPGITDEASLAFRDEEAMLANAVDAESFYINHCIPKKIELNITYARHATIWRDVQLIFRTIRSVWFRK